MAAGGSGSRSAEIDVANIITGKRFRSSFPPKRSRSSSSTGRLAAGDLPPAATTREEGALAKATDGVVEMLRRYFNCGGTGSGIPSCIAKAVKTSDAKLSAARDHLGHVPSDLASYANWSLHQVDSPEYLCYRPPSAVPPVPLTILYEPFAKFTQNLEGTIGEEDLEFAQTFWDGVQDAEYVTDHKAKVFNLTELLSGYLDRHVVPYAKIFGKGFVEADGILLGRKLVPIIVLEWKAEPGKSGDPYFEALDYVKRAAAERPRYQTISLVICIQGPWLSVSAASVEGVDNKAKVWAQPLTETRCFGDWKALEKTARIWRAVRLFIDDVEVLGPLPRSPPPAIPWLLKAFTEVKRPFDKRLFFTYINAQGMQEAAKFVLSYGQEAHQAWSEFAPELKSVQAVGTDWKLVTMEYLAPENGWMCADDVVTSMVQDQNQAQLNKFHACVAAAAEAGHCKGYVHGDFRLCNIMVKVLTEDYEIKVVDFDWSGKEGTVMYPTMVSRSVKWHNEVRFGALVRKEHDLHFIGLAELVNQLLV